MIAVVSFVSIVCFLVAFSYARIVPVAAAALSTAQGAFRVMRDPAVDDDAREAAMQGAALKLIGTFASIFVRSVAAVVASMAPIYLADVLGLAASESVIGFLSRWDVILGASLIITGFYFIRLRLWPRR